MNGMLDQAVEDFSCTIATRPNDVAARFNRAVVLTKLNETDRAMRDCEQVSSVGTIAAAPE